ncbi:palmitoyl-protein thioesterase 1 isoform X3 [Solanum pennellii]|uniref:Palmitoyl-protein thioesterase 1 isoform X3 n=1 Tax=Solanum pennellii TaxID=28526 RepID=A0ABM1V6N3_SOLPN|nr:palmitoyl-protein thioesterase 1 isoform X3 [Solanum pennellii]
MKFTLILINFLLFTLHSITTYSLPFVVFHGISDKCSNGGITHFTELLSNWSGSSGHCIEIGNGEWDSWFMPFAKQVDIACQKLKKMSELSEGYNMIGLSQGNMVGRGVIEFCDDGPPVRNLISLAGPHAGIASIPFCGSGIWCILADSLLKLAIYSNFIQAHLAPAGYIKIPTDIANYRKGCKFLPVLNNEVHRNSTYKKRFASLENLVLIMTSWFGYYPDGSFTTVLPAHKTKLYTEDWIGLKKLDEAGKVKLFKVCGSHLEISTSEIKKNILPYLLDNVSTTVTKSRSSGLLWPSSFDDEEKILTPAKTISLRSWKF